jgi:hypothetical protein
MSDRVARGKLSGTRDAVIAGAMTHAVHYHVVPSLRFTRLQLFVRLIAFCALGVLGLSFGTLFLVGFLALPVYAAARADDNDDYAEREAPRIAHVLRWIAAICAWTGLVVDRLPSASPDDVVHLEITPGARPTASSAAWRVLTGLPSAIALAFLGFLGIFVWLWAALSILVREQVGAGAHAYLVGLQRWSLRLLAYQASLVDEYPPFSFDDTPDPEQNLVTTRG